MSVDKEGTSRRRFLRNIGAAAALTGAAYAFKKIGDFEKAAEHITEGELDFLEVPHQPRQYPMRNLARVWKVPKPEEVRGLTFTKDLTRYTGIHGRVPSMAHIDFRYQLAAAWKDKIGKLSKKNEAEAHRCIPAIKQMFLSYDPEKSTKMNILAYQGKIGRSIEDVRSGYSVRDVTRLRTFKDLTKPEVDLVAALEKKITGMSLLAYSLTELMPTDGKTAGIGVEVYDFLLKNAGREYIENGMPAYYDNEFSFGPYQLTPGVFKNDKGGPYAAALIDRLGTTRHIPDDLKEVRGDQHHKAAYQFAVYNLGLLVKRIGVFRSKQVLPYLNELPRDFVTQYIAASHHNPGDAIIVFENFIDTFLISRSPEGILRGVREPDIFRTAQQAAKSRIANYVRKTAENSRALNAYFRVEQLKAPSL